MAVIFQIVTNFQDRRVLEQRFQHRDGIIEPDLVIGCRRRIKRETPLPIRLDDGAAMPGAWKDYKWGWQRQKGF